MEEHLVSILFIAFFLGLCIGFYLGFHEHKSISEKPKYRDTAHAKIATALDIQKPRPQLIMVPQDMFDEFAADVKATGHAQTVWGIPVIPGDVKGITFVRKMKKEGK
jgi:hypothetical protein